MTAPGSAVNSPGATFRSSFESAKNLSLLPSESVFSSNSVPASDLLKRILSKTTCQPLRSPLCRRSGINGSLKNFQDYLQFKEHSTENLLFWNWYKRYRMRFHNLPENERNLSPAPLLTNQYVGPNSPVESKRIPKLRIKGTDKTIGGDFSRSAELTTVSSVADEADSRLTCHLCRQSVLQFNHYERKSILSLLDS
jgi:hypothetical protein